MATHRTDLREVPRSLHYLSFGGARSAAVGGADAAFCQVLAERTAVVPEAAAGGRRLRRSRPGRPARPGCGSPRCVVAGGLRLARPACRRELAGGTADEFGAKTGSV